MSPIIVVVVVVVLIVVAALALSAKLVAVVVRDVVDGGEPLPHLIQEPVPLPDSPGHDAASEARREEDDDEDAGPETAAETVTAGVALPAGGAVIASLLPLQHGLSHHTGVEALTALHQVLSRLRSEPITIIIFDI